MYFNNRLTNCQIYVRIPKHALYKVKPHFAKILRYVHFQMHLTTLFWITNFVHNKILTKRVHYGFTYTHKTNNI